MAKQTFAFTNFTAGELSPRLDGRTDLGKYFNGTKTLENMLCTSSWCSNKTTRLQSLCMKLKDSAAATRINTF